MNILVIGDVVGNRGCEAVRKHLPGLKKRKGIDLVIANGENSADGNGITPSSAQSLFQSGVDVITTGNHVFRRKEIYEELEENPFLIRPANFPSGCPGKGISIVDKGRTIVAVINIMGTVFMDSLECPFTTADRLYEEAKQSGASIIIYDIHAEATAEKKALGFYLDGRASVVFGTHTHVQTADDGILPKGTGYLTDVGMVGPLHSVLGIKPELAITKMKSKMPVRFENGTEDCEFNGCIFEVDEQTKMAISTERIVFV